MKAVGQVSAGGLRQLAPVYSIAPEAIRGVVPSVQEGVHSNRTMTRTENAQGAHVEYRMDKPFSTCSALGGDLPRCSGPRDKEGVVAGVVSVAYEGKRNGP